jgi:uncharacterized membrane protein
MELLSNPHPAIVHFAIALFVVGAAADLAGLWRARDDWRRIGRANLLLGSVAAVLAAASGWYAEETVEHVAQAHAVMELHETFGWVIAGLATALVTWRVARPALGRSWYALAITLVALLLLLQGYWGGELVFRYGVGVAAKSVQTQEHHEHGAPGHHQGD